ncbi:phage tail protein [Xenorhabdus sp. Flor]|uniref:phage tail-collar fiber domain-containing protein n=1 Tax=Xenorhabdus cabanillasii TaxID=351673 RepID=UPI0019BE268D|nr:phage tail protein [Xenorhabdus sp. Flor]MBD2815322.1 phage tail protein [Xenorhabdus sp. Flor]
MSSVITTDFEKWKAQQVAAGHSVVLDEFVFANVPGLEPSQDISRSEQLPAAQYIVHRQAVNKTGLASENAVAYSVTLGTEVGNFDFNWIGLLNKASGVIGMITHAPAQKKIKTANGLQGNVLTRSFLLEFDGAAKETAITTTAETWQIDFTARLSGMDEMQRLINTDSYGEAAFFGDGFAVIRNGDQYTVKKGLAYVGGLRGVLEHDQTLNQMRNTRVYADFSYQGNLVSQWKTAVKITAANELQNFIDAAGYPHYVFAIASIDGNGNVIDLRPKGALSDRDIATMKQELGRVKQDYATQQALKNGLDGKQSKGDYATNSALNEVNDNANSRLEKAKNGTDIQDKRAFVNNLGLTKTVQLAQEALPKNSTERFTSGAHTIQSTTNDYVTLRLKKPDGRYTFFESTPHDSKAICAIGYREPDQTNINVVYLPKKTGMVAMADEVYPKSAVYTKADVYKKSSVYTKADVYTKAESDTLFSRQKNVALLEPVGWWRDSDTGYTRQWGYLGREEGSVGTTVVTFPTQFFKECTSVTVAHIRVSGGVTLSVTGVTKSGFTVIPSENCNGVFWSAEGY